ncbi:SDR family NAD(P)-dependent oxidoreductase [Chrysiogenes arsenatis]|uniref:SDR family NAD(P)-dependent oxidoreductase n=1 Tax=Chrysiogenes arsenatis TaxID=309797 RepID=UPI0003F75166|nr:SDR family NAD(P)-dependent oxidoreductase [Chrysiogenes arsenatis]
MSASLVGKKAFITGASSGIGLACAHALAKAGAKLLLCARNQTKLEMVAAELAKQYGTQSFVLPLDVCRRSDVATALESLPAEWQAPDILINNAGLALGLEKLHENSIDDWETMIDTNIKGVLYLLRGLVPGMIGREAATVINVGSTAGRGAYPNGAVYCACKAALRIITDGLRMDTIDTPLRVSIVEPGMTETNFSNVRFHGDTERAKQVYTGLKPLTPEDVAEAVLFMATRPAHVQIHDIMMSPTHQASGGMIYRVTK